MSYAKDAHVAHARDKSADTAAGSVSHEMHLVGDATNDQAETAVHSVSEKPSSDRLLELDQAARVSPLLQSERTAEACESDHAAASHRSRNNVDERGRAESSRDSSEERYSRTKRTRSSRSSSPSQLHSVLEMIVTRLSALEDKSRKRSPAASRSPSPHKKRRDRRRSPSPSGNNTKIHRISRSPSKYEQFVYPSDCEHEDSDPEKDRLSDDDLTDLLLEGKEAEKKGPPLGKPAKALSESFFDCELPVETIRPLREKYLEPENCENHSAKSVNTEIYRMM